MSYFTDEEFQCKCGKCKVKPVDPVLLARLNGLRSQYGKPIYITSAWRCEEQNKKVGGVAASAHLEGQAADIFCTSSHDRYLLLFHSIGSFHRIGIGATFLHVDVSTDHPQELIWLYEKH
jgi:uncharacterized protein YcbK (DUF882 family)